MMATLVLWPVLTIAANAFEVLYSPPLTASMLIMPAQLQRCVQNR
jgi:hypothetical protein